MIELKLLTEKSIFCDRSDPKTGANHEMVRSEFEYYVTSVPDSTDPADI